MKKTVVLISVLCILLACQKQSVQPQSSVSSISEDAVTAFADSVKWDTLEPGEMEDFHTGKTVCLFEHFTVVPHTTAFVRAFAFTITKSAGATLSSAKLFIDGQSPRTMQITGSKLVFTYVSHPITPESENLIGGHSIAMRITGDGAKGEWYQVRLDSVLFIKKDPKRTVKTINLPQTSDKMLY